MIYGYSKVDIGRFSGEKDYKIIKEKKYGSRRKINNITYLKIIDGLNDNEATLINDMKNQLKYLEKALSKNSSIDLLFQIGLTCIKFSKYSDKFIHSEKYFVLSYSIFKQSALVYHDYYISDEMSHSDFYSTIKGSVDFVLKEKVNHSFRKTDPFVLTGNASIKFTHEYIGHILEDDYFKISPIRNMLGRKLLNDNIQLMENYNIKYEYDDVGNEIKRDVLLIKNGVIINTLSNSTGNIVMNIFDDDELIRMRSMKLYGQVSDFDINSYNGLVIEDFSECEFSAATGGISFIVSKSYIVENGRIKRYLNRFYIYLTISELIQKVLKVSNDYSEKYYLCGKSGQLAVVKTTSPTICIMESEENLCN